ncbi:hypothetical protein BGW41_001219 [Actinomortierella wolfii]|nr:hypothetical protein BGW41_001219 [Actinomortierella wolfii]
MSTTSRSARNKTLRAAAGATTTKDQTPKKKVEIVLPPSSKCCSQKDATIQQLSDDLEEAVHDKEQLQARLAQLEERVDYKETSARIAAAMLDNEKMELRENTRKLGIQLSAATHERDTLKHEKEAISSQLANCEDERKMLSTQLTEAWRRIPRLKSDYTDALNRLSATEKEAERLKKELEKAIEQANAAKAGFEDEKTKWERERRDLTEEVASLKDKLVSASTDGGKQMMDFDKDLARVRAHHKADREKWDAEKKRFMDQIASFRVKLTTLSVQQPKTAPPPEWLLEKQSLEDKCADLTSKLAEAEQATTPYTKADADRLAKLEAKNAALKAKLKEVLEHATTVQAEADQFRNKLGKKAGSAQGGAGRSGTTGRRGGAAASGGHGGRGRGRRATTAARSDSESASESEAADEEGTGSPALPPPRAPRPIRAKRQAAEKKIISALESSSSSESESSDLDDLESESDSDEDGEESVNANEESQDKEQEVADASMDVDEPGASVADVARSSTVATTISDKSDEKHMEDVQETLSTNSVRSASPSPPPTTTNRSTRSSGRTSSGRAARKAADDSDSEFEPPVKVPKPRGKGRTKTVAKQGGETEPKPAITAGSKRPNDGDNTTVTDAPLSSPSTPLSATPANSATSISTNGVGNGTPVNDAGSSSSKPTPPAGNDTQESGALNSSIKVKKKRRLLGKGLEDYNSIIQGPKIPGSPSANHIVGLLPSISASLAAKNVGSGSGPSPSASSSAGSTPLSMSTTSSLGGIGATMGEKASSSTGRRNQANKEALNAIKLAFSVPKARRPSEE